MTENTHVIAANDATFEELVLRSDKPVLVELGGTYCKPCQALMPILARIAEESAGAYKVVTVDVDQAPGVARRFAIRGVPTTMAFAGGAEKGRILGLTTKAALLGMLAKARPAAVSDAMG